MKIIEDVPIIEVNPERNEDVLLPKKRNNQRSSQQQPISSQKRSEKAKSKKVGSYSGEELGKTVVTIT